jgi:hypothetical protein
MPVPVPLLLLHALCFGMAKSSDLRVRTPRSHPLVAKISHREQTSQIKFGELFLWFKGEVLLSRLLFKCCQILHDIYMYVEYIVSQ